MVSKSVTMAPPMDISGSRIGVNASKVLFLHPTHAPTKFGADLSHQWKNDTDRQTDRPTDRQSQPLGLAMTQCIIADVNVIKKA